MQQDANITLANKVFPHNRSQRQSNYQYNL